MKKIFFTIIVFISICSYGQNWTNLKIDSFISASFPENYQKTDTLGQQIFHAQTDNALIIITKKSSNEKQSFNASNENELIESYKSLNKDFIKSQNGQLIKEEIIVKNGLKLTQFSAHVFIQGVPHIVHCVCIFINSSIYLFSYYQLEESEINTQREREHFFSSISFANDLTMMNQFTKSSNPTNYEAIGELTGILLLGIAGVVIIFINVRERNRRKKFMNLNQK